MPTNEEITAALVVLMEEYDNRGDDLRKLCYAMLEAAEGIRFAQWEREIRKALRPDHGENGNEAS